MRPLRLLSILCLLPLVLPGCTARYIQDLPQAPGPDGETTVLDSRSELADVDVRAIAIDGDRVAFHVHRVSVDVATVERTRRPIRREKISEASWGPGVHLPVWTLGWAVLAPVWVYAAFYDDLRQAARWGLDVEEGRHDPEGSAFGPQVDVRLRETQLAAGPEIVDQPGEPVREPEVGATVEARWASGGAIASGRTGDDGIVVLALGDLPAYASPTTPVDVTVTVSGRPIHVRAAVLGQTAAGQPAEREIERTAAAERRFLDWIDEARARLDEEGAVIDGHLRVRHDATARKMFDDWGQWVRMARRQMTGIDATLRTAWDDRFDRFEAALDEARSALDAGRRDLAGSAVRQAISVLR